MTGAIAIIYAFPTIDSNPTMVESLAGFAEKGYCVDVYTCSSESYLSPKLNFPGIRFIDLYQGYEPGSDLNQDICSNNGKKTYDFIIGCDPEGLILACPHALFLNVPLIYLSFELVFWDEIHLPEDFRQKQMEVEASRFVDIVIIQDVERATLLSTENKLPMDKFSFLPVSPKGPGKAGRSQYLREKFQIPELCTILLHSGDFSPRTMGHELVSASWDLPVDSRLVIHSRSFAAGDTYFQKAKQLSCPDRIIFSSAPLDYEHYQDLVASCDIGIVIQNPGGDSKYTQKNLYHIGRASGKLSFYAKCGKPIIANQLPSFKALISGSNAGRILKDMSQLPGLVREIMDSYPELSKNSLTLFSGILDFSLSFPDLIERLSSLKKTERKSWPQPSCISEAMADIFAEGILQTAVNHAKKGNLRKAEKMASYYGSLRPGNSSAQIPFHFYMGVARKSNGEPEKALRHFQMARVSESEFYPHIKCWEGAVFRDLERYDEAVDAFREAMEADPENSEIRLKEIMTLMKAGRFKEAARSVNQGIESHPETEGLNELKAKLERMNG